MLVDFVVPTMCDDINIVTREDVSEEEFEALKDLKNDYGEHIIGTWDIPYIGEQNGT